MSPLETLLLAIIVFSPPVATTRKSKTELKRDRLVAAEVVSDPRGGWYAKSQTWIQSHDCPRCGYDRAERTHENYHDIEAAETVECRACGYVIDQWDTL